MTIRVEERHFDPPLNYLDCWGCPLAKALRELYPNTDIVVGGSKLSIGRREYRFDGMYVSRCVRDRLPFGLELEPIDEISNRDECRAG
jgi:hypothetical protein